MADHIAANKKGKELHEAVGDAAMALAKDAEGEAAKFAFLRSLDSARFAFGNQNLIQHVAV